jgi:hypothetical protein
VASVLGWQLQANAAPITMHSAEATWLQALNYLTTAYTASSRAGDKCLVGAFCRGL